ncbi:MAG: type VI secretion system baseplate subunit TssF, partial [Nannocystaceae bacterium]
MNSLLRQYQSQLRSLRSDAAMFASECPDAAATLSTHQVTPPGTEQLLQGVAYLTALIQ